VALAVVVALAVDVDVVLVVALVVAVDVVLVVDVALVVREGERKMKMGHRGGVNTKSSDPLFPSPPSFLSPVL